MGAIMNFKKYRGTFTKEQFDKVISVSKFEESSIESLKLFFIDGVRPVDITSQRQLMHNRIKRFISIYQRNFK